MNEEIVKSYLQIKAKRKELASQVAVLEKEEQKLAAQVIEMIPLLGEIKVGKAILRLKIKVKPVVGDWLKFYDYIRSNNAFDLLHKRITETAVKLRWDDKVQIPGVSSIEDKSIEVEFNE